MIDLNINLELVTGITKPAVIKLLDTAMLNSHKDDIIGLYPEVSEQNIQKWKSSCGTFEISFQRDLVVEIGEIWLVFPDPKKATRFFRPSANSNTLMFTERCDQYCIMCSQPPKNKDYLHWGLYEKALISVPSNTMFGISGGEPLLEKQSMLTLIENVILKRPDIKFHVLTNAQNFGEEDILRLTELNKNILWGIPLYSTDSEVHDAIVGKQGAHTQLLTNFTILYKAGAQVELRTVLLQQNAGYLSLIVNFIADKIPWISYWALMQLEPIGFARISFEEKFFDSSKQFEVIKLALDCARIRGISAKLYNFPYCSVEKRYRANTNKSISDWKNKYLETCDGCKEQEKCCGFFEWYQDKTGYENIGTKYL